MMEESDCMVKKYTMQLMTANELVSKLGGELEGSKTQIRLLEDKIKVMGQSMVQEEGERSHSLQVIQELENRYREEQQQKQLKIE